MQQLASSRISPRALLGYASLVALVTLWRWLQHFVLELVDFYPLYYGGVAWLQTGSAYNLGAVAPASYHGSLHFEAGNGYPLPAVLLALPLSLLPPQLAAALWAGLLTASLLFALRLNNAPLWLLFYLPTVAGIAQGQYTVLVLAFQLVALWAYREQRLWALAICSALMLTKPSQAALLALLLLVLSRAWRQHLLAFVAIWGGALLLDPGWLGEWLGAMRAYSAATSYPVLWQLAPLALALLLARDLVGTAALLQLALTPFPGLYITSSLPLSVARDNQTKWLCVLSFLWPFLLPASGPLLATLLTLVLPMVALVLLRWLRASAQAQPPASTSSSASGPL